MPKVKSSQAQIMMRDSYETANGIFDHSSEEGEDPFALIRMRWSEDTVTGGPLHQRMRQFAINNVGKVFNMSFTDFINQPTYIIELMLEVTQESDVKKAMEVRAAVTQLTGD